MTGLFIMVISEKRVLYVLVVRIVLWRKKVACDEWSFCIRLCIQRYIQDLKRYIKDNRTSHHYHSWWTSHSAYGTRSTCQVLQVYYLTTMSTLHNTVYKSLDHFAFPLG